MKKLNRLFRKTLAHQPLLLYGALIILAFAIVYTVARLLAGPVSERPSQATACTVNGLIVASACFEGCGEDADCASGLVCLSGLCRNGANPNSPTCLPPNPSPVPSVTPKATPRPSTIASIAPSPVVDRPVEIKFAFINVASTQSNVTNIKADGKAFVLSDGTTISQISLGNGQTRQFTTYYGNFGLVPNGITFTVASGAVRLAGIAKDVATGQTLLVQPGTQTLGVGNWILNKNGTITKV